LLYLDAIYQMPIVGVIYIVSLLLGMVISIVFICRAIYRLVRVTEIHTRIVFRTKKLYNLSRQVKPQIRVQ